MGEHRGRRGGPVLQEVRVPRALEQLKRRPRDARDEQVGVTGGGTRRRCRCSPGSARRSGRARPKRRGWRWRSGARGGRPPMVWSTSTASAPPGWRSSHAGVTISSASARRAAAVGPASGPPPLVPRPTPAAHPASCSPAPARRPDRGGRSRATARPCAHRGAVHVRPADPGRVQHRHRVLREPARAVLRAVGRRARPVPSASRATVRCRAARSSRTGSRPTPGVRLPGQQQQRLAVPDDIERDAHRKRAVPVSEGPAPSAATANSAASPSREPAATIREGWNAGRTSR